MAQETGFSYVRDLAELRRALEARGEKVVVYDNATVVFATTDGLESAVQLIWSVERGALHVVEVYGSLVPHERRQEVFDLVNYSNTQVNMPAFQLRKQPNGWKVAYSTCGFLDHEGRLSTRVAVELIKQTRIAGVEISGMLETLTQPAESAAEAAQAPATPDAEKAPEPPRAPEARAAPEPPGPSEDAKAYAAFAARVREKLANVPPPPVFPAITPAERVALEAAFVKDLPRFARRVATAQIDDYGAPFFRKVRVLRLAAGDFPAEAAFATWTGFGPVVLSGNPLGLVAMCAEERPAYSDDPDLAIVLGNMAGAWTGASLMSFVQIGSVDDIPFRRAGGDDAEKEAEIRRTFADTIHPPRVETTDGGGRRVTTWLVSESRLRRRVSEVRPGAVWVTEEVIADVPVHPGRGWGMVNGRLIPTG